MAKKYDILDANQKVRFHSIYEAINECMGTDYTGWMKACWPNVKGNGKFRLWFPKLARKKNGRNEAEAFDCVNTISEDWNEFTFDDLKDRHSDMNNKYTGYDLIFAKEVDGDYIFRGLYVRDEEKSAPNHDVSKRIASKVKLVGNPVYDIEPLDEIDNPDSQDINTPMEPEDIIPDPDVGAYYVCGRCGFKYRVAQRCPECGQLVWIPEDRYDDEEIYSIEEIERLFDSYGIYYESVKGSYRIMGRNHGSSLNLNKKNYVIYSTNEDFRNLERITKWATDLELVKNGNSRDAVRPNTVKCKKRSTLEALLEIYANNPENLK